MTRNRIWIAGALGLVLMGAGFWLGRAAAETGAPGSAADPLVSKSYVDQMVSFRVVNVPAGQIAQGEAGTEIVVRAGKATVIASAQGGVLDATVGVDLKQGQEAAANHLLVIPRTDGRGLLAKTDLVLMVKGPIAIITPKG
jgi:hypothetical protein